MSTILRPAVKHLLFLNTLSDTKISSSLKYPREYMNSEAAHLLKTKQNFWLR